MLRISTYEAISLMIGFGALVGSYYKWTKKVIKASVPGT